MNNYSVRRAASGDLAALVELRVEMFRAMGVETSDATGWRASALSWFADRVHRPDFGIFVIEVEGEVVAGGMGQVRDVAPSPASPEGGDVLISNICTLPTHRRRGYGSAVFAATLDWARGTGVGRIELMATQSGRRMYEQAGFAEAPWPAMRATPEAPGQHSSGAPEP